MLKYKSANKILWNIVLLFLLYQSEVCDQPEHAPVKVEKPSKASAEQSLEEVFAKLDITEYAETFIKEGIDMDALLLCNDDDLKEGGLPLGKLNISIKI